MTDDNTPTIDELADEYLSRCRDGKMPRIEDYARQYPEMAEEIRELFPAIAAMEDLKTEQQARHERQAWVGPGVEQLGDFRLVRELGRGGMGVVYEAEQESLGRRVAVKILPRPALLRGHARERFEREARTAAKLHHTNIVPVFGVGHYEDYHFLVMQYIAGIGLDEILRAIQQREANPIEGQDNSGYNLVAIGQGIVQRRDRETPHLASDDTRTSYGSLDTLASAPDQPAEPPRPTTPLLGRTYYRSIAQIGTQVSEALAYAHAQGTLHRDIKPGNLLLDADGTVWVADFGLAKAIDQDSVTHSGDFVGTLRYMAPEQFDGQTDARSDIYSLGLTLHELLTLRPAFADSARTLRTGKIGDRSVPPPRRLNPHIPLDLETIVQKAVSRDPADRYQSADELNLDLRLFLEERPIRARRITAIERLWRWSKRNRELAGLLGTTFALLLTIVGLTSYGYYQANESANRLRIARDQESEQRQRAVTERQRAETTVDLTIDVLDRIFDEFAPSRFAHLTDNSYDEDEDSVPAPSRPVLTPERSQLLNHMLNVFQQLADQEGEDARVRRKTAEAHRRVGDIQRQLGDYEQARAAYAEAQRRFGELASDSDDPLDVITAAALGNELGLLDFLLGAVPRAIETLEQTRQLLTALPSETRAIALARYELARTLYLMADVGHRPPRPPRAARDRGERGDRSGPGIPRMLRGPRDRDLPRPEMRDKPRGGFPGGPRGERGAPRGEFRDILRDGPRGPERDLVDADALLKEATEILEGLIVEQPNLPEYRHLLAQCDTLPRRRRGAFGREDDSERGLQLLRDLVKDFPNVPEYRLDLAQAYVFLGRPGPREDAGGFRRRGDNLQNAIDLVEQLRRERPGIPEYTHTLAKILERQARLHQARSRNSDAERILRRAVNLQADLAQQFPNATTYVADAANFAGMLGEFLADQGRVSEATPFLRDACDTLLDLMTAEPERTHIQRMTSDRLRRLIDHLQDQGRETEAAPYQRALDELRPARPRPRTNPE